MAPDREFAIDIRWRSGPGRSKDIEIIVLRHQLAVLRRQNSRTHLTAADRSLLGAIAADDEQGGWSLPTPCFAGCRRRIARHWTPARPATGTAIHRRRDPAARHRHGYQQSHLGLPAYHRRARWTGPPDRCIHRVANPQSARYRPCPASIGGHLVAVPALPGCGRLRLLEPAPTPTPRHRREVLT